MPRIFDNINERLLAALKQTMEQSHRADFCVGYFNLRGWKPDQRSRRAVGGRRRRLLPCAGGHADIAAGGATRRSVWRSHQRNSTRGPPMRLKRRAAEEFRQQLTLGAPTD